MHLTQVYVLSIQYQNDTYETVEEPQLTSSLIKGLCQMLGHHDHSTDDKRWGHCLEDRSTLKRTLARAFDLGTNWNE